MPRSKAEDPFQGEDKMPLSTTPSGDCYPLYLFYLFTFFTFVTFASGQINELSNATTTPIPGAGHDYIRLLDETVNPANGSVSLRINLGTPI